MMPNSVHCFPFLLDPLSLSELAIFKIPGGLGRWLGYTPQ